MAPNAPIEVTNVTIRDSNTLSAVTDEDCGQDCEEGDDTQSRKVYKLDKSVQVSPSDEVKIAIKIATFIAEEAKKGNIPYSYKYPTIPYCSDSPCTTMARLVSDLLINHSVTYSAMVNQLAPDVNDGYKSFKIIADIVFEGGTVTWGRIVSLYALQARVVLYLRKKNLDEKAMQFARFVGRYLGEKAECWIQQNGGWDSLNATYPSKHEMEGKIWRGLLLTGLGLGVAAAYLAAH